MPTGVRHLELDAAAVFRVANSTDQPRLLEPVEPVRHRAARNFEFARQVARRAALPFAEDQRTEHLPLAPRQLVLAERVLERVAEPPLEAVDPVDDPLDLVVEARDPVEALEEVVDVVALDRRLGFGGWGHGAHFTSIFSI